MSKKVIHVSLNQKSIDNAIKELRDYQKWLETKTKEFLEELAKRGVDIYNAKVRLAIYDGDNDAQARAEIINENTVAVIADGNSVLFIEFGTGVWFPDSHPEAAQNGMKHGEYGHKLAKRGVWRYKGNPGTNGEIITKGKHAGEVLTYGNPANMSMYYTIRDLEREFSDIAKRVFTHD